MLLVGYCFGTRSERRLCEEVHLNLAWRWCCRLGLADRVPDHSTFSNNCHGRFRDSDLFRRLFEAVPEQCIAKGLVRGEAFGAGAALIRADASRDSKVDFNDWPAPKTFWTCNARISRFPRRQRVRRGNWGEAEGDLAF